jgi:hypothetical protein
MIGAVTVFDHIPRPGPQALRNRKWLGDVPLVPLKTAYSIWFSDDRGL